MKLYHYILTAVILSGIYACEKDITVDLPSAKQQYVVEASINQYFPNLNYVFISKSIDYFNPDLSLDGVKNALVYITEGVVNGTDTTFPIQNRVQLFDISLIPGMDTILPGISGIYLNPLIIPRLNGVYKLEIKLSDSTYITGRTYIPKLVPLDSVKYEIRDVDNNKDGAKDAFATLYWFDPPEQNNYRLTMWNYTDSFLIGWGGATNNRTFDDEFLNGVPRTYSYASPFQEGDTLNLYFNSIGRKEFLFWQSFGRAANNGGPFATPVQLKSNIAGAIGSFTGYACSFKQVILKQK